MPVMRRKQSEKVFFFIHFLVNAHSSSGSTIIIIVIFWYSISPEIGVNRLVLCRLCVYFVDEISHTHEYEIISRCRLHFVFDHFVFSLISSKIFIDFFLFFFLSIFQLTFKCSGSSHPPPSTLDSHVDPHTGVSLQEVTATISKDLVYEYFGKSPFKCDCHAWSPRGKAKSQSATIEVACK